MARNKRPRKHHQPHKTTVPMMTETRDNLALEFRLSVESLILAPSADSYNSLLQMIAALKLAGMDSDGMRLVSRAINLVCDRFERVGKVGVSDSEAQQLRDGAAAIDAELGRMPLNVLREAIAQVKIDFVMREATV